jgi:hypothetical protein
MNELGAAPKWTTDGGTRMGTALISRLRPFVWEVKLSKGRTPQVTCNDTRKNLF